MKMQLPLPLHLKLIRHHVYTVLKFRTHVPIKLSESANATVIEVEEQRVVTPSPLRWKLCKLGW